MDISFLKPNTELKIFIWKKDVTNSVLRVRIYNFDFQKLRLEH